MRLAVTAAQVRFYAVYSVLVGLAWSFSPIAESPTAWDKAVGIAATTGLLSLCGLPSLLIIAHVTATSRGLPLRERRGRAILACLCGAVVSGFLFRVAPVDMVPTLHIAADIEWRYVGATIMIYLTHAALLTVMLLNSQQALEIDTQRNAVELSRLRDLRDHEELRLRQLQKQIEPHFVVNALANVKELDRRRPGSGRELLRTLADYLSLAISPERLARTTVRDELTLTEKYLDILAVRMGTRLEVEIDVPQDLRDAAVPPLVLGTLVENAIKHGIAPRGRGGHIRIQYRRQRDDLVIRVMDDGVGFRGEMGSGIGLVNTRDRLAALYGDRAKLELRENPSGGVVASVTIPREVA